MATLIAEKELEWAGNTEALAVVDAARSEIEIYRRYSDYYGYAFFVMSRPAAG
jgi:hypothetical protein